MDNESFEQYTLTEDQCGDGVEVSARKRHGRADVLERPADRDDAPAQVVLEITYTEPAARGNTATNVNKPATVQTGATVHVPAFINQGDKIKVDARTGVVHRTRLASERPLDPRRGRIAEPVAGRDTSREGVGHGKAGDRPVRRGHLPGDQVARLADVRSQSYHQTTLRRGVGRRPTSAAAKAADQAVAAAAAAKPEQRPLKKAG